MTNEPKQPGVTPGSQNNNDNPESEDLDSTLFREEFNDEFSTLSNPLPHDDDIIQSFFERILDHWFLFGTKQLAPSKITEISETIDTLCATRNFLRSPRAVSSNKECLEVLNQNINSLMAEQTVLISKLNWVNGKRGRFIEKRYMVLMECADFWERILGNVATKTDNSSKEYGKPGPFGRFVEMVTRRVIGLSHPEKNNLHRFTGSEAAAFVGNNRDAITAFVTERVKSPSD
ncbi:MAG: hypothetical protein ABJO30_05440 [Hyphomicrobiales bacterium]